MLSGKNIDHTQLSDKGTDEVKPIILELQMKMVEFLKLLLVTYSSTQQVVDYLNQRHIDIDQEYITYRMDTKSLASANANEKAFEELLDKNNIGDKERILANFRLFSNVVKPSEPANTEINHSAQKLNKS